MILYTYIPTFFLWNLIRYNFLAQPSDPGGPVPPFSSLDVPRVLSDLAPVFSDIFAAFADISALFADISALFADISSLFADMRHIDHAVDHSPTNYNPCSGESSC